ncbi:hypothetical protein [Hafnia paralvei]|uniref:hypothetical protein n=1 Tax=Hafnia paralvei TaxID=546367 RepID=UPI0010337829|nr:hypothetical protein [Hafnia paralvei]TBL56366.1 hypothetical protein EYY97_22150 [Hafnia paralvei]
MALLESLERFVTHHFITVDTDYRTQGNFNETGIAKIKPMRELISYLNSQLQFTADYINGSVEVSLQDIKYWPIETSDYITTGTKKTYNIAGIDSSTKTHACILLNYFFKDASKSVLRDKKANTREIFGPSTRDQGLEVSSHVFISLDVEDGKYDAIIERIPRIPTNITQGFLNKALLRVADKYPKEFNKPHSLNATDSQTGKVITIRYKCRFIIDGKIDPDFLNQIKDGYLKDVTLVKDSVGVVTATDYNQPIIPIEEYIRLDTRRIEGSKIEWLHAVCGYYKKLEFTRVKVSYTAPDGISGSATMKTDMIRAEGIENKIIKKSMLTGFSSALIDSYETIQEDIAQKMSEVI